MQYILTPVLSASIFAEDLCENKRTIYCAEYPNLNVILAVRILTKLYCSLILI